MYCADQKSLCVVARCLGFATLGLDKKIESKHKLKLRTRILWRFVCWLIQSSFLFYFEDVNNETSWPKLSTVSSLACHNLPFKRHQHNFENFRQLVRFLLFFFLFLCFVFFVSCYESTKLSLFQDYPFVSIQVVCNLTEGVPLCSFSRNAVLCWDIFTVEIPWHFCRERWNLISFYSFTSFSPL